MNKSTVKYPKDWTINNERDFLQWYGKWANRTGVNPNPDHPGHYYDYRTAYLDNVEPNWSDEQGQFKWPSSYKAEDHPNRFVPQSGQYIDTITNKPAALQDMEKWAQARKKSIGDIFKNASSWSKI